MGLAALLGAVLMLTDTTGITQSATGQMVEALEALVTISANIGDVLVEIRDQLAEGLDLAKENLDSGR